MNSTVTLKRTIFSSYFSAVLIILFTIYLVLIGVFMNLEFRRIKNEINKTFVFFEKELKGIQNLDDSATRKLIELKISDFDKLQESSPFKNVKIVFKDSVFSTSNTNVFYSYDDNLGKLTKIFTKKNIILKKNFFLTYGNKSIYLQIYSDEFKNDLIPLIRTLVVSLIFILLISFLAIRKIKRVVQQPIKEITQTVKTINRHDLSQRIHIVNPHDELGQISITINEMIERLEVSFKSQTRFISNASHELRTPLAVIKGYADLLEAGAKFDPKMVDHGISEILKEVKNMENLLQKLLFLAKKENRTIKSDIKPFQISNLITELIEKQKIVDKDHTYTIIKNNSAIVNLDKTLLLQALRELLKNSSKYTPSGGIISIESFFKKDVHYIIIRDTGKGIPKENIDKVFERFYIQDQSRNRQNNSFGLGLSIVKDIVQLHGGKISIKSKVNQGTSIFLEFPILSNKKS